MGVTLMIALLVAFAQVNTAQVDSRATEVRELIKTLRDEGARTRKPEVVVGAIVRFGELRAVESIDPLVELLTFRRTFAWEDKTGTMVDELRVIGPAERYPAIDALFHIGQPALPALTKTIVNHDEKALITENALIALMLIFRDNSQKGVEYLRLAAQKAEGEAATRLWSASDRAQSMQ